jgi:hypothetical protein
LSGNVISGKLMAAQISLTHLPDHFNAGAAKDGQEASDEKAEGREDWKDLVLRTPTYLDSLIKNRDIYFYLPKS